MYTTNLLTYKRNVTKREKERERKKTNLKLFYEKKTNESIFRRGK